MNVSNINEAHSIKNYHKLLSLTWPSLLFSSSFLTMLTVTSSGRSLKISEQIDMLGQLLSSNGIDVKVNKYNILSKVSASLSVRSLHGTFSHYSYSTDLFWLTFIHASLSMPSSQPPPFPLTLIYSFTHCSTYTHSLTQSFSLTHSLTHSPTLDSTYSLTRKIDRSLLFKTICF